MSIGGVTYKCPAEHCRTNRDSRNAIKRHFGAVHQDVELIPEFEEWDEWFEQFEDSDK